MKADRGALERVEGDLYMTHVARVVKILLLLQCSYKLTIKDMVQRFGISRRTVYYDLEELEDAGVQLVRSTAYPRTITLENVNKRTAETASQILERSDQKVGRGHQGLGKSWPDQETDLPC